MKPSVAVAIGSALFVVGCNSAAPSPSPASPGPGTPGVGDASWYFSIEEVGLGPDGYVTLLNYTDQAASLDMVFLCQATSCVDLPDVVVEPGEVARIAVGDGAGLQDVAMTGARLSLPPADGEVGVYGADRPTDPEAIRAYIQWGSTPHELTDVADEAGVWRSDGWAPSGPNGTRLWKTDDNLWVWDAE